MKRVHRVGLSLAWLVLAIFMIIPQVYAANLESPDELEAFFDGALALQMRNYNIPGAAVAIVKDGQILFSKGYGFADLDKQIPMDPETTLHRPGSNSKIIVWTAVMQLVEKGLLDLYTDINSYLDFTIPSKVEGREAPPITLHHLLTHSAGFEDTAMELFVSGPELMNSLGDYVKSHLPARVFQPGSVMAYSNYGTTLAAYIVELVSGQAFSDYAQEHILEPLGMTSSTFEQPLPDHLLSQMSEGYRFVGGRFISGEFEYVQAYPAGSLSSTTHDMARLIMSHLNMGVPAPTTSDEEAQVEATEVDAEDGESPEYRMLQEDTARLMQTQQLAGHPEVPGMAYGFIEADYNGHRVLSHGGNTLLFTTGLYFLPEQNVGFYVVYNAPVGNSPRLNLFQGFMDRYFPEDTSRPTMPRAIAAGLAKNYAGTFHSSRSNFTKIESVLRFGQTLNLWVDQEGYVNMAVGGTTTRYGEVAPNLFQELNGTEKVAFSFDDGKVTKIHFAGPVTWLRTAWYQTRNFIIAVLSVSVLFMLGSILRWIRSIFRPQPRRRSPIAPKVLSIMFFLLFITVVILFVDVLGTVHPAFGVPIVALEPSSTLKAALALTKILVGLAGLMLLTTVYLVVTTKGNRLQRLHYILLTLSSLGIVGVLYQLNLF
jgi:CubicO group peptidase (beta-lactamase class C family)